MPNYDWPGSRNVDVTMDRVRASGTIDNTAYAGRGGTTRFVATSRFGLIENSSSDFRIVQLYYRAKNPSPYYEPVYDRFGNHKNVGSGDGSACRKRDTYNRLPSEDKEDLNFYGLKNRRGDPVTATADLYCKHFHLYQLVRPSLPTTVQVGGITIRPPAASDTKYYKLASGHMATYRATYLSKTQAAAMQWKNEHAKGGSGGVSSLPNIFYPDLSVFLEADALLNADPDYKKALSLPPNRLPNGMPNFAALRETVKTVLGRKGWPTSQINAFLVSKGVQIDSTSTRLPGGGSGGGQSNRLNNPPKPTVAPTPAVTKVVVRAPYGFAKPATKAPDNRPQIVQNYKTYVKDNSADNGIKESQGQDIFVFPYTPNNISYSGLGSKWNNIDRAGNFPIVEWSSWDLMRCEMEFLVAEDRIDGSTQVPDGMFVSVQNRLNTLRRMSQRQAAVSVFNLDDLFRVQVKRAQETGKALQFVIADLSITSTRRSVDSVEKEITAASVKLTLQEIPIEEVTLVKMSPPIMSKPVTPGKPGSNDDGEGDPLFTDGWRPVGSE